MSWIALDMHHGLGLLGSEKSHSTATVHMCEMTNSWPWHQFGCKSTLASHIVICGPSFDCTGAQDPQTGLQASCDVPGSIVMGAWHSCRA